jgi:hypothetical protein
VLSDENLRHVLLRSALSRRREVLDEKNAAVAGLFKSYAMTVGASAGRRPVEDHQTR